MPYSSTPELHNLQAGGNGLFYYLDKYNKNYRSDLAMDNLTQAKVIKRWNNSDFKLSNEPDFEYEQPNDLGAYGYIMYKQGPFGPRRNVVVYEPENGNYWSYYTGAHEASHSSTRGAYKLLDLARKQMKLAYRNPASINAANEALALAREMAFSLHRHGVNIHTTPYEKSIENVGKKVEETLGPMRHKFFPMMNDKEILDFMLRFAELKNNKQTNDTNRFWGMPGGYYV